ncbi:MAG: response regulator transcription factor [Pseudomonadota bacterium]|jgi:two-component system, NarL family, invasion response regulator UvrY|nr:MULTISPECIES: response regulator transcription factor [Methylophaga]MEC9412269.1 response regulator transcription factor [Pseudomonadota bacterium]WVI84965.1 response regulator transcription factor [Methylophaga thalassica]GLQ00047.1 DNA-binding response regulator [Methylophaga thalassica]HIC46731.1 response regulator transcription factor [Methylophaga sp.]HIM39452.1 response regulator transcription factor [Methylophaga aminisulfidivorans]
MKQALTILVVDDHPIVRAGCRQLIQQIPSATVLEAETGEEGYRLFQESQPDMVLLDITLPGVGGLEVLRRIRANREDAKVLMFSMHEDPVFASRAMQSGARGYITKNNAADHLVEAVNKVLDGKIYLSPDMAQQLAMLNIDAGTSALSDLSRRELEILRLLGEGKSMTEISEVLGISYKTVANNLTQIKSKLDISKTAELMRFAISHGISS